MEKEYDMAMFREGRLQWDITPKESPTAVARRWLFIGGLVMVFAGWFAHSGENSWWELVEAPDRVAPLLTGLAALISRHGGGHLIRKMEN